VLLKTDDYLQVIFIVFLKQFIKISCYSDERGNFSICGNWYSVCLNNFKPRIITYNNNAYTSNDDTLELTLMCTTKS
jgi:hypothetical protein